PARASRPRGAFPPAWPSPGSSSAAATERLLGRLRRRVGAAARRQLDRLVDLDVAGAPAEVPRERLADLAARRVGTAVEQIARDEEEPRSAVAALGGPQLGKGPLQRIGLGAALHPRDRRDRLPLAGARPDE